VKVRDCIHTVPGAWISGIGMTPVVSLTVTVQLV
jgi:hypothetical protein